MVETIFYTGAGDGSAERFLLENHDAQLWNMEIQGQHFISQRILKKLHCMLSYFI